MSYLEELSQIIDDDIGAGQHGRLGPGRHRATRPAGRRGHVSLMPFILQ